MSKDDPKPLSAEERAEAVKLCEAATVHPISIEGMPGMGEWYWEESDTHWRLFAEQRLPDPGPNAGALREAMTYGHPWQLACISKAGYHPGPEMRAFIAASRTLIPRYEATVRELEAEVARLHADIRERINDRRPF